MMMTTKSMKVKNLTHNYRWLWIGALLFLLNHQLYANPATEDNSLSSHIEVLLNATAHPDIPSPYTAKEQATLKQLYQPQQLLWLQSSLSNPAIAELLALFHSAAEQGLKSSDYANQYLATQWRYLQQHSASQVELSRFDIALSLTFIRYLNDLHYGRVDPETLRFHLPAKAVLELAGSIAFAIQTQTLNTLAEQVEPKLMPYQQLKQALAHYQLLQQQLSQTFTFSFEKSLRLGDFSSQMGNLDYYLDVLNTPIAAAIPIQSESHKSLYSEEIEAKVRQLQTVYHLESDGVIGKQTLEVLNTPLSQRIQQIELSMERLRWLPKLPEDAFILVNIPAFQLWAYSAEHQQSDLLTMRVIVGKAKNRDKSKGRSTRFQTPVFTGELSYLVFNPYWNIPKNIARREILPLLEADYQYLDNKNMEIVQQFSNHAEVLSLTPDNLERLYSGQLHLRQRPGKGNALGHIKFIFPNAYNVYLHDTASRSLFKRTQRDFSHGCIRVAEPNKLAMFVLQEQAEWDHSRIQRTLARKTPNTVGIVQKIPVFIFYTTALVTQTGVAFYRDIYKHDPALLRTLAQRSQGLERGN
ncbi:MAG: L,D-transpeptidase family protein [Methyloprofundus sp.]|nr:L,D-transpeptidase family protein [Methyloprofundus sp.]